MKLRLCSTVMLLFLFSSVTSAQESAKTENEVADAFFAAKTVVFLGDSITYHGEFIAALEGALIANERSYPQILNLGLSSETCSGDSEPAHPWPRPNVHERFERVLEKVEPDLLIVNYGMNDGIYHPFDESRFENYKNGINKIIEAAENSDGKLKVILVTPPPFDALPLKQKNRLADKDATDFNWRTVYENYDSEVIAVYSQWILRQSERVAGCIDLRLPILADLAEHRKTDSSFHYAHDGVHVNSAGQKLIGDTLANAIGLDVSKTVSKDVFTLLKEKQQLLRDSWLTEVGHKRPGIKAGPPLHQAIFTVGKIESWISDAVKKQQEKKTTNENSNH